MATWRMNSAVRTFHGALMKLLHALADWRVNGAARKAAICCGCSSSSGNSAINVLAMTTPTPGTDLSNSSFSQQTGEPAPHRRYRYKAGQLLLQRLYQTRDALAQVRDRHALLTLAFGSDHLDDLPPAGDQIGNSGVACRTGPYAAGSMAKWEITRHR